MITPELISYIKTQQAVGKTNDQIKIELLQSGGWSPIDVQEAFVQLVAVGQIKTKRNFSGLVTLLIVLLILGGGIAFGAQKYNIHSIADVKDFIATKKQTNDLVTPSVPEPVVVQQEVVVSQGGSLIENKGIVLSPEAKDSVEESIIGELFAVRIQEKLQTFESGEKADLCSTKVFTENRKLFVTRLGYKEYVISEKDYNCKNNLRDLIVSLPLPGGGYFCVDSKGFGGVVDYLPTGFTCGNASVIYTVNQKYIEEGRVMEAQFTDENIVLMDKNLNEEAKRRDKELSISVTAQAEIVYDASITSSSANTGSYAAACAQVKKEVSKVTSCFSNASAWAATYTLTDASGGGTACIDSTGYYKTQSKQLTSTICPR